MKNEDRLKLVVHHTLALQDLQSLHLLYQPLVGIEAIGLYQMLHALGHNTREVSNHLLLTTLLGCSISKYEKQRKLLEQYNLVRSSYHSKTNGYLLEVLAPLAPLTFLAHPVFGRLYIQKVGEDAYDFNRMNANGSIVDKSGYYNISEPMENLLKAWDDVDEASFAKHKSETQAYDHLEDAINFDYEMFLKDTTPLIFPLAERTTANLKQIGLLASMYGVPALDMRQIVAKSIDLKTQRLDLKKMKQIVLKRFETLPIEKLDNPYLLSPVKFLQYKQNGVAVNEADKKILDMLLSKYQFQPEVVNALVEYTLSETNQKLVRAYIEKIASTWVRLRVDSLEQAQQAIATNKEKPKYTKAAGKSEALPDWYQETDSEEAVEVDEAQLGALLARLKEES
ncbi:MAG: DnaD domain protein [Erysipelotrichaceae bacterium]